MGTSCFLNRIQKARSMKEKMDELNPFLRSLNLHVGFSGGLHCFVLRPLILTHTWSGISDGVWITVQLPHSYPKPSSAPRFLCTFDSSGVIPAPAALSSQGTCVCHRTASLLTASPPISFCSCPVHSAFHCFFFLCRVCFILLFFLKVYFYKQKYSMLIITFISIPFS